MIIHDFAQGSPEWDQHRATHFNASDAPAMMGCSAYMTRTELLTRLKTGITPEVDDATQRRFDDGHRFEALARPLGEKIIGQQLYPLTGSRGELSASFDGLTDGIDGPVIAFEHKTLNTNLMDLVWVTENAADFLPVQYLVQMEQQMLVSGAERVLFMASKWDADDKLIEERHCWYVSNSDLRAQIVRGWQQLANDLAVFVPTETKAKPTGQSPETLPALRIEVTGEVTASNLAEFKETALAAIHSVNKDLQTDQDFADAAKAVKWCEDVESRLEAAKQHALSQTASIDALFKTMDDISAEARRVRLDLDKLVKARKDAIKAEIVRTAQVAFVNHIDDLNVSLGLAIIGRDADFGLVVKGLKTVTSMQNAVDTELARAKIAANEKAEKVRANLKAIQESGLVVHDTAALVLKAPDDLAAVLAQRKAAEVARQEAERERIRREEAARLEREAAQKAAAEKAEADRVERERAHAAQAEAQRTAREKAEAAAKAAEVEQHAAALLANLPIPTAPAIDTSARMSLGQINERIAPICTSVTVGGQRSTEEAQANARLIAAAPELLELLRDIVYGTRLDKFNRNDDGLIYNGGYNFEKRISAAIAAIAKAEGKAEGTPT